jgi:predicted nucleic acid-binding protein
MTDAPLLTVRDLSIAFRQGGQETRSVLLDAARLCSVSALKLSEAIHLATATRAGCAAFVTLDAGLDAPGAVPTLRPDDSALG